MTIPYQHRVKTIRFIYEQPKYNGVKKSWENPLHHPYIPTLIDGSCWDERILFWQQSRYIGEFYGDNYKYIFLRYQYPESEVLRFPNTSFDTKINFMNKVKDINENGNNDFGRAIRSMLPLDKLQERYGKESFVVEDDLICNEFVQDFDYYWECDQTDFVMNEMTKIMLPGKIDQMLGKLMKGYVGVSLHRKRGTWYNKEVLEKTGWDGKLLEEYKQLTDWCYDKKYSHDNYKDKLQFIHDDAYFEEIDKSSKLFVASDLPKKFWYNKWKKRFNDVITIDTIRKKAFKIVKDDCPEATDAVIHNLIEWLCLSFCDRIVGPRNKYHSYGKANLIDYVGGRACMTAYSASKFRNRNLTYVTCEE